eukprot:364753-Chlamydomonas_euryale.AAC.6
METPWSQPFCLPTQRSHRPCLLLPLAPKAKAASFCCHLSCDGSLCLKPLQLLLCNVTSAAHADQPGLLSILVPVGYAMARRLCHMQCPSLRASLPRRCRGTAPCLGMSLNANVRWELWPRPLGRLSRCLSGNACSSNSSGSSRVTCSTCGRIPSECRAGSDQRPSIAKS